MAKLNFNSIKDNVLELYRRFTEDEITALSAQLSYYFLLSLFPLLIFIVSVATYLPIDYMSLLGLLSDYMPEDVLVLIETFLNQIIESSGGGLISIGIIGTLWSDRKCVVYGKRFI